MSRVYRVNHFLRGISSIGHSQQKNGHSYLSYIEYSIGLFKQLQLFQTSEKKESILNKFILNLSKYDTKYLRAWMYSYLKLLYSKLRCCCK